MIQICMKHIVSHMLYGLSLFLVIFAFYVTMKGPFVSSSGLYFIKKTMHRKSYDLSVYLMACDLLWIGRHELEDIMAIYDNMRTYELI